MSSDRAALDQGWVINRAGEAVLQTQMGRGGSGSLCFLQRPEGELQSSPAWPLHHPSDTDRLQHPHSPRLSSLKHHLCLCSPSPLTWSPFSRPLTLSLFFFLSFFFLFIALCILPRIVQALIISLTFNPSEASLLCLNIFFSYAAGTSPPKAQPEPTLAQILGTFTLLSGPPNLLFLLFFYFPTQPPFFGRLLNLPLILKLINPAQRHNQADGIHFQCWIFCFAFFPGYNSLCSPTLVPLTYILNSIPRPVYIHIIRLLLAQGGCKWSCIISNKYKKRPTSFSQRHNLGCRYFFLKGFWLVKLLLQFVYWKGGRLPHFLLVMDKAVCCIKGNLQLPPMSKEHSEDIKRFTACPRVNMARGCSCLEAGSGGVIEINLDSRWRQTFDLSWDWILSSKSEFEWMRCTDLGEKMAKEWSEGIVIQWNIYMYVHERICQRRWERGERGSQCTRAWWGIA